jgi:hypothetical protein
MSKADPDIAWLDGYGDEPIILSGADPSFTGLCRSVSLIQRQMRYMTAVTDNVIAANPKNMSVRDVSAAIDAARRGVDLYELTLPQRDEAIYCLKSKVTQMKPIAQVPVNQSKKEAFLSTDTSLSHQTYDVGKGRALSLPTLSETFRSRTNVCFMIMPDMPSVYEHLNGIMKQMQKNHHDMKYNFFAYVAEAASDRGDRFISLYPHADGMALISPLSTVPQVMHAATSHLMSSKTATNLNDHAIQETHRMLAGSYAHLRME